MICTDCNGSGACDPCDGYGVTSDSYPNAGDGAECDACWGDGICSGCLGGGSTDHEPTTDNEPTNDSDDVHDERVNAR